MTSIALHLRAQDSRPLTRNAVRRAKTMATESQRATIYRTIWRTLCGMRAPITLEALYPLLPAEVREVLSIGRIDRQLRIWAASGALDYSGSKYAVTQRDSLPPLEQNLKAAWVRRTVPTADPFTQLWIAARILKRFDVAALAMAASSFGAERDTWLLAMEQAGYLVRLTVDGSEWRVADPVRPLPPFPPEFQDVRENGRTLVRIVDRIDRKRAVTLRPTLSEHILRLSPEGEEATPSVGGEG